VRFIGVRGERFSLYVRTLVLVPGSVSKKPALGAGYLLLQPDENGAVIYMKAARALLDHNLPPKLPVGGKWNLFTIDSSIAL
jgi:hypothetical protein